MTLLETYIHSTVLVVVPFIIMVYIGVKYYNKKK